MTYHELVVSARSMRGSIWLSALHGALAAGITFSVAAADVTVQPVSGNGFVVKDSTGATDRFRVQDSGLVSLPSVPTAAAQSQSVCIAASGLLGPCSGGGSSYSAGTGLSLTGSIFSVAPPFQLPQACASNQVAQWNGSAWVCGTGGSGSTVGGGGTANYVTKWTPNGSTLGNSTIYDTGTAIGIGTTTPVNALQIGNTPSLSGNQLAIGNSGSQMSFFASPQSAIWYSNTNFSMMPIGPGSGFVGIGTATPASYLDIHGVNARIGLTDNTSGATATLSRYSNRLEVSPSDAFQISVGGLDLRHFWIGSNGNVGIGTGSPANRVQIGSVGATGLSDNDIAFGNGTQASGIFQAPTVAQWASTTNIALMPQGNGSGRVGINTVSPSAPLEVAYTVDTTIAYAYLKVDGGGNSATTGFCPGCTAHVAIRADGNVLAAEFDAVSDKRVKDILGISDSSRDLAKINSLEVTDYTLKDKLQNTGRPFKKVIAQQVETVYPQVVSKHVDFIPNVYRAASSVTKTSGGTLLHFDRGHSLSPGAKRIKMLVSGDNTMQRVGIVSIPSEKDVLIDAKRINGDKVFVYGEEVDDFRTVDYDGLTALNISATQELSKQLVRQRADLAALVAEKDAQLADLCGQLAEQKARVAALEDVAGEIAQIRAQLAALKRNTAPAQLQEALLRP